MESDYKEDRHPKRSTYRDKRRQETIRAIMDGAKKRLEETPTLALSLRSVADLIGMAPSAVYRYFASREALITALCVDSYNSLADYIELSLNQDEADHKTAGVAGMAVTDWKTLSRSYRQWSLHHPAEFALLFGPPQSNEVTDTEATIKAARRFGDIGLQIFAKGIESGEIILSGDAANNLTAVSKSFSDSILAATLKEPTTLPIGLILSGWACIHGVVCLEVFGFLSTMVINTEVFFEEHLNRTMEWMGFRI